MAKNAEVIGTINELKAQQIKAFNEIRAKLDEQNAKIEELTKLIEDGDVSDDIVTALGELKTITQQLDDIVPDAQPNPDVTQPPTP